MSVIQRMMDGGPHPDTFVAVNAEGTGLAECSAPHKIHLETTLLRGMGSGGDPERGRALAEEHAEKLKSILQGLEVVFIVSGLGGGTGSGISPVIARLAKEAGALVLCFVSVPFECEGSCRARAAEHSLEELREVSDAVICLPNQKIFGLINETTSVLESFRLTHELLADCARSLWRLLANPGILELRLSELCQLLRGECTDCVFAVAEAAGATRSRVVMDKLLAHPLLDGGTILAECDSVLVSLVGGPDLTMTEIDRIMQELNTRCGDAQVHMGAAIEEVFRERLALTVIAVRKSDEASEKSSAPRGVTEEFNRQLLNGPTARPGSRFVPPPPALPPEQVQQMLAQQGGGRSRPRRTVPKFRQTQLPLEIVSKGRFDKSEPTIHKGEDLDVPTYIRRGVSLN